MSNDCCVIGQRAANAVGTLQTHDLQPSTVQIAICKTCVTCNTQTYIYIYTYVYIFVCVHLLLYLLASSPANFDMA